MHTGSWMRQVRVACVLLVTAFSATSASGQDTISDGDKVSLEYTLKANGETVDSNVGKGEALIYTQGAQEILPALEKKLTGLKAGDTKTVKLSAEDGYGKVHAEAVQTVPKDKIPEDARKAGAMLRGEGPNGEVMMARVVEVKEDAVVVDFNHPLAGKALEFDVKVIKVEAGKPGDAKPAAPAAKPAAEEKKPAE